MLAGFIAVLILTGITGWVGMNSITTIAGLTEEIYTNQLQPIQYLAEVTERVHRIIVNVL
jgi:uncharacterized Fe-S cluster-containing radical SAM superfamily protein